MRITDMTEQKKNKNRLSVFLDGNFSFGIDAVDAYQIGLKIGGELSQQELTHILETVEYEKTQQAALRLAANHAYSEKRITDKLREKGFHPDNIEKAVSFLKEYGYVNDMEYARQFVEESLEIRGFGRNKIRQELFRRGISKELIDQCMEEADLEGAEQETILLLLEKKLAGNYEVKNIEKAKRFLYTRGYSFDMIHWAVKKLQIQDNEGWE